MQTSEDITDLLAGSYRVTVTDANGCFVISPEYAVDRIPLPINIEMLTVVDPTCAGDCNGSVTIQIQGGDPPYNFSFDDGVSQTLSTANPTYTRTDICAMYLLLTITDGNGNSIEQDISLEDVEPVSYTHLTLPTIYSV